MHIFKTKSGLLSRKSYPSSNGDVQVTALRDLETASVSIHINSRDLNLFPMYFSDAWTDSSYVLDFSVSFSKSKHSSKFRLFPRRSPFVRATSLLAWVPPPPLHARRTVVGLLDWIILGGPNDGFLSQEHMQSITTVELF